MKIKVVIDGAQIVPVKVKPFQIDPNKTTRLPKK
jgi:hypothetical protein